MSDAPDKKPDHAASAEGDESTPEVSGFEAELAAEMTQSADAKQSLPSDAQEGDLEDSDVEEGEAQEPDDAEKESEDGFTTPLGLQRMPLGISLPDEEDEDAPVRVMGSSARATKEKRRTQILVRGAREPAQGRIAPDITLEGELILYVLDELSEEERNRVRDEIRATAGAEDRLKVIRRHLEIHQSLPSARPSSSSFLRLTQRMKEEGHLTYAYPGSQSIWRRSFFYGLVASLFMAMFLALGFFDPAIEAREGVPFGSFNRVTDSGENVSRAISLETPLSTGAMGGSLWLATPRSGVATEIRCQGITSVELLSRSHLKLESGLLSRIRVHSEALYPHGFLIETRHGSIRANDAEFSVDAQSGRTIVNVARGHVEVLRANGVESYQVVDGRVAEISETRQEVEIRPFVEIKVDVFNAMKKERVALVTLTNTSQHELRVRSFGYEFGEFYPARLVKNDDAADGESVAFEGTLLEHFTNELDSWTKSDSESWVVLEPSGNADKYQFVVDFSMETQSWNVQDLKISMKYSGEIISKTFGKLDFPMQSQVKLIDFKSN